MSQKVYSDIVKYLKDKPKEQIYHQTSTLSSFLKRKYPYMSYEQIFEAIKSVINYRENYRFVMGVGSPKENIMGKYALIVSIKAEEEENKQIKIETLQEDFRMEYEHEIPKVIKEDGKTWKVYEIYMREKFMLYDKKKIRKTHYMRTKMFNVKRVKVYVIYAIKK